MSSTAQAHALRGFTLVEACISLVLASLLCALALPSLTQAKKIQQLKLLAQTVMTDLQQARSDSLLGGSATHIRIAALPSGTCYVFYSGEAGACRCETQEQAACTPSGRLIRFHWIPTTSGNSMQSNVTALSFHSRQGTVTSTGHIEVSNNRGESIRHVIAITGRVRTCSPNGSVSSLPQCA